MFRSILTALLIISSAQAAYIYPSAFPVARNAHIAFTAPATATPTTTSPTPTKPQPTLLPRCENPPCEYDGEAQTLSAATVTSTILSTTSVPCYITTYITDSTTTTETIYSTETITSTVTEQNTVWIIKYSPTPVVKSTVFESVIQITQTQTSMWIETEGGYYEETKTGDVKTVDGGQSGGGGNHEEGKGDYGDEGEWKDAGSAPNPAPAPAPAPSPLPKNDEGQWKNAQDGGASPVPAPAPAPVPSSQGAWTHATAANAVATPTAGVNVAGAAAGTGVAGSSWTTANQGGGVTVAGQPAPAMAGVWPSSAYRLSAATSWYIYLLFLISIVGGGLDVL